MNEFREMIMDGIRKRHSKCSVMVERIKGNNGTSYEGFWVKLNDTQCFPVIPCEGMECALRDEERTLEEVLDEVDRILGDRVDLDASFFSDYENIKKKIFLRVINKEQNKELLEHAPHMEYLDLVATFRIGPIHTGKIEGSTLITYPLFREWGITEDELFAVAYENSFKVMPEIISMKELMQRMISTEEVESEQVLELLADSKEYMHVCGYRSLAGAACILNKELMQKFSEEVGADILILPSSIYELILLPMKELYSVERFVQIVNEVNQNVVPENEILSGHIYKYDRMKDEVIDLCA